MIANDKERQEIWDSYLDANNKISMRLLQYSFSGFSDDSNAEAYVKYEQSWFDNLISQYDKRTNEYATSFYSGLFPPTEDTSGMKIKLEKFLEGVKEDKVHLRRHLKESIDDMNRKTNAYKCFLARAKCAKN